MLEVQWIKHSSLENMKVMLYLFKCKLMISSLVQITTHCVKSLLLLCRENFEMSMMGELTYFLGLQVKQLKHGTFLGQILF